MSPHLGARPGAFWRPARCPKQPRQPTRYLPFYRTRLPLLYAKDRNSLRWLANASARSRMPISLEFRAFWRASAAFLTRWKSLVRVQCRPFPPYRSLRNSVTLDRARPCHPAPRRASIQSRSPAGSQSRSTESTRTPRPPLDRGLSRSTADMPGGNMMGRLVDADRIRPGCSLVG